MFAARPVRPHLLQEPDPLLFLLSLPVVRSSDGKALSVFEKLLVPCASDGTGWIAVHSRHTGRRPTRSKRRRLRKATSALRC